MEEIYTRTLSIYSRDHTFTNLHPPEGANEGLATVGRNPHPPGISVRAVEIEQIEEEKGSVMNTPNIKETYLQEDFIKAISFIVAH